MNLRVLRISLGSLFAVACSGTSGSGDGGSDTGESTAESASTDGACWIGGENCPCTMNGGCDPGLECVQDVCVPPLSTTADDDDADDDDTNPTTNPGESTSASDDASSSDDGTTGEPADLDAWTKRRPVLITNPNDADMVEYQAKIDIDWDDDMANGLVDLRFTDTDGVLLPHWIESSLAPVSGRIWVRVPLVPADDETTIWMWYGNPEAEDASDGDATFDLWNDFEEDLDETQWMITDDATVVDGALSITTGGVISIEPMITLPGSLIEIRARWPGGAGAASGFVAAESQGAIGDQDLLSMTQSPLYITAVDGPMTVGNMLWNNAPGEPGDQFEWHSMGLGAGVARFGRTHEYIENYLWWHDFPADIPNDYYLWLGHVYGALGAGETCLPIEIDVLLSRKFAELPNEASVGGEEDV